eukprot:Selendium_serpulae@DN3798_c1_g1_i1.p1
MFFSTHLFHSRPPIFKRSLTIDSKMADGKKDEENIERKEPLPSTDIADSNMLGAQTALYSDTGSPASFHVHAFTLAQPVEVVKVPVESKWSVNFTKGVFGRCKAIKGLENDFRLVHNNSVLADTDSLSACGVSDNAMILALPVRCNNSSEPATGSSDALRASVLVLKASPFLTQMEITSGSTVAMLKKQLHQIAPENDSWGVVCNGRLCDDSDTMGASG